ncbi:MAG: hypothetical protein AAF098_16065 [Pseudomonadota bacterium]
MGEHERGFNELGIARTALECASAVYDAPLEEHFLTIISSGQRLL